jgi:hypothetical protein
VRKSKLTDYLELGAHCFSFFYRFGQLQVVDLESIEPSLRAGMHLVVNWLLLNCVSCFDRIWKACPISMNMILGLHFSLEYDYVSQWCNPS